MRIISAASVAEFYLRRAGSVTRDAAVGQLLPGLWDDVDTQAAGGIAVRTTTGRGTWQYSLDQGLTFRDFGSVSTAQSLLLRDTDRIRYVPAAGEQQAPSLGFVAWDQSSGPPGSKVSSSVRGGTTAFSSGTATARAQLIDDQDIPQLFAAGDANLDFRFDALDIVQVLQSAKYRTGQEAQWEEGDWNGDRVFDQLDIALALQGGHYQ